MFFLVILKRTTVQSDLKLKSETHFVIMNQISIRFLGKNTYFDSQLWRGKNFPFYRSTVFLAISKLRNGETDYKPEQL